MRDITPSGRTVGASTAYPRSSANQMVAPYIVHATECLAGGTLGFLQVAIRELAQMNTRQTLVFSRRADTPADVASLFPPQVELIEVAAARGNHRAFIESMSRELRRLVRAHRVSAVHLHSSKAGFVGRLALGFEGPPVRMLYSPHGLSFLNSNRRFSSAAYWLLERMAATVECQPVACSESEAEALGRVTHYPAFVLENPVEQAFFDIQSQEEKPPLVISCGRICEQKAPEVFAELAVRARIDLPDTRFVWIGSGDLNGEKLLRAAGVEVTGWIEPAAVRDWMSRASLYVQTSRWEGMPLSVIQALAAGLPCVVTNAVGNRDAVTDGECGFVVKNIEELTAHVELLLKDNELRQSMRGPARECARRRFSRHRFREALAELYELAQPAEDAPPVAVAKPSAELAFAQLAGSS